MHRCWAVAVVLSVVASCAQIFGLSPISSDAGVDEGPPKGTVGGSAFQVTFDGTQPSFLRLDTQVIDTSTDPRCQPGEAVACVMVANDISVVGSVTVISSVPQLDRILVLAAWNEIVISGRIDASSVRGGPAVPGRVSLIGTPTSPTGDSGGAGGGLGSPGGGGGNPSGGRFGSVAIVAPLSEGVPGQPGGSGTGSGGPGGTGGGAIHLIAGSQIHILGSGHVLSCGAGGGGTLMTGGGGGGGGGGYLGFDAPVIANDGEIRADGGGGGASRTTVLHGADGCSVAGAAPGGAAGVGLGAGGAGSLGAGGTSGQAGSGAGGGGGGAGYVYASTAIAGTGTASPVARAQ